MRLRILDDRGHHAFRNAPLGLQVEDAPGSHPCGIALGPFEIGLVPDDHLQFVRCRLGDRHTQSKYPEKGCVPDVSRNISSPLACSVSVSTPSG